MKFPDKLIQAIKNDKLVVFVGAGLSMSSGLPSWKKIVENILQSNSSDIEKSQAYLRALQDEILTPLDVLDRLQERYRKEIYDGFEREIGRPQKSKNHETISKISKRIVTTNYDKLLECNSNINVIDVNSSFSLQKIDSTNEFILKIHGDVNSLDKAIIFTSDYEELYDRNGLANFQIKKILSLYSCLFIGFSMSDHYVSNLFQYLDDIYDGLGVDHYAISTNKIDYDFVKTIEIDSYDALPEVLEALVQSKNGDLAVSDITIERAIVESAAFNEITLSSGSDAPPVIDYWAGREVELEALDRPFKVSFITGIGGQGKSALASKYLSKATKINYEYIDWKDFKEEDLNFQEKLYKIIGLVSREKIGSANLVGLETEKLVEIFFDELGMQKGIFVFDNVDRYVDLKDFTLSEGMGVFLTAALSRNHQSRFIFTCRPFIHLAEPAFFQIKLSGLEYGSVAQISKQIISDLPAKELEVIAKRIYALTSGHPLWVNIILGQYRNGISSVNNLLDKIENKRSPDVGISDSSIMSTTILKEVWSKLKDKEKTLLRALSIAVAAENKEDLAKIVSSKINYNQFSRCLKSLRHLNLIIEKEEDGFVELHPLVREFIKSNYASSEQQAYVSLFVKFYDQFIIVLKSKIGSVLSGDEIEKIRNKIEILIDANDVQAAVNDLTVYEASFHLSGYTEDFVRLCDRVLRKIEWKSHCLESIKKFNDFFFDAMTAMSDYGAYDMADHYMNKLDSTIKTVDEKKIMLLSARTYKNWVFPDFEMAIKFGRTASELIEHLGVSEKWQAKNRLHLALRDSGTETNIKEALRYFFVGLNTDEISLTMTGGDSDWSATLGNIGRCFSMLGDSNAAYYYVVKSYLILKENATAINRQNLGYASEWLGDLLAKEGGCSDAAYFYAHAKNIWKNTMPTQANRIIEKISKTANAATKQAINDCENWQLEKHCNGWINEKLQFLKKGFPSPPGLEYAV